MGCSAEALNAVRLGDPLDKLVHRGRLVARHRRRVGCVAAQLQGGLGGQLAQVTHQRWVGVKEWGGV